MEKDFDGLSYHQMMQEVRDQVRASSSDLSDSEQEEPPRACMKMGHKALHKRIRLEQKDDLSSESSTKNK